MILLGEKLCSSFALFQVHVHWLRFLYYVTIGDYKWYALICWMAVQEYKWYLWGRWECFKYWENADFDTLGIMMQKQLALCKLFNGNNFLNQSDLHFPIYNFISNYYSLIKGLTMWSLLLFGMVSHYSDASDHLHFISQKHRDVMWGSEGHAILTETWWY